MTIEGDEVSISDKSVYYGNNGVSGGGTILLEWIDSDTDWSKVQGICPIAPENLNIGQTTYLYVLKKV